MSKVFVVQETTFEYNDEWYYPGESEGGQARKAFKTRERAEGEARVLARKKARSIMFGCYLGEDGFSWGFNNLEKVREIVGESAWDESWEYTIPDSMSDKDLDTLLDSWSNDLFKVVEIELE